MFGRRKIKELEDKVLELDAKLSIVEGLLEVSRGVIDKNQRRCVEQAKDFDEKLIVLNRKIAELEEKAKQSYDELNEKARATDKDRDSEKAVPMSQVMDEWLNGKKAGEN